MSNPAISLDASTNTKAVQTTAVMNSSTKPKTVAILRRPNTPAPLPPRTANNRPSRPTIKVPHYKPPPTPPLSKNNSVLHKSTQTEQYPKIPPSSWKSIQNLDQAEPLDSEIINADVHSKDVNISEDLETELQYDQAAIRKLENVYNADIQAINDILIKNDNETSNNSSDHSEDTEVNHLADDEIDEEDNDITEDESRLGASNVDHMKDDPFHSGNSGQHENSMYQWQIARSLRQILGILRSFQFQFGNQNHYHENRHRYSNQYQDFGTYHHEHNYRRGNNRGRYGY